MKTAEKLLRIRAELQLSQEALARELHVSFTSINRWENEKTVPSRRAQMMIDTYCEKNNIKLTDTERKDG